MLTYRFICYQINPALESAIVTFVEHQERRNHEIVEDVLYLINENECQIAEYMEVPKVSSVCWIQTFYVKAYNFLRQN